MFLTSLVYFRERKKGTIHKGSWSTTKEYIQKNIPYPLWQHPDNKIHGLQWQLLCHAIDVVTQSQGVNGYETARDLLDRGLQSCQMWWASPENMARADYKPEYILDGGKFILDSINSLNLVSSQDKSKAEQIYKQLEQSV